MVVVARMTPRSESNSQAVEALLGVPVREGEPAVRALVPELAGTMDVAWAQGGTARTGSRCSHCSGRKLVAEAP